MERFKAFMTGAVDVAKIFGVVMGILGLLGGALHFAVWLSNRADATEMVVKFTAVNARQDVADVKASNEAEWRRAIWDQTTAIARRVGAQVVPQPVISAVPADIKGDVKR
jgi:hypothetical protein